MAKSYEKLRDQMSEESRERAAALYRELRRGFPLAAIRAELGLTQEDLAQRLDVSQVAVSRLESRGDFLISTLRNYVHATGGKLGINLHYPSGCWKIVEAEAGGFRLVEGSISLVRSNWSEPLKPYRRKQINQRDLGMVLRNVKSLSCSEAA